MGSDSQDANLFSLCTSTQAGIGEEEEKLSSLVHMDTMSQLPEKVKRRLWFG